MAKTKTIVGIEFDDVHIRAVRVQHTLPGSVKGCLVEKTSLLQGSYSKDEEIVEGLKQIRGDLDIRHCDGVTACMAGKQLYVGEFPFRKVPRAELDSALKFEIKKHIPFDTSAAAIEYQVEETGRGGDDGYRIVAAAVQRNVMGRFLGIFTKAGMKPAVVDVLPLVLVNALEWSGPAEDGPALILHVGPGVSTLVFAGNGSPFFSRSTFFTAHDIFDENAKIESDREKERRLTAFTDEVHRSISYYISTFRQEEIRRVLVTGEYGDNPEVGARLKEKIGLETAPLALLPALDPNTPDDRGAFAPAAALALRADLP